MLCLSIGCGDSDPEEAQDLTPPTNDFCEDACIGPCCAQETICTGDCNDMHSNGTVEHVNCMTDCSDDFTDCANACFI